jgi:hypothetical protein
MIDLFDVTFSADVVCLSANGRENLSDSEILGIIKRECHPSHTKSDEGVVAYVPKEVGHTRRLFDICMGLYDTMFFVIRQEGGENVDGKKLTDYGLMQIIKRDCHPFYTKSEKGKLAYMLVKEYEDLRKRQIISREKDI